MSPWFTGFGILVLLAFFFKRDWHFLAFWHLFLHLGILTILASLAFLASWHLEIKKDTIKEQALLWFWHLCSSMLFSFEFHNAKMSKMPKMPNWSKCQDAKKDAKTRKWLKAVNILSEFQLSSSVWYWQCLEDSKQKDNLMN